MVTNPKGENQYSEVVGNCCPQPKNQKEDTPQPQQRTSQKLAEQYNVSERTIRTDAASARVIDAIGEIDAEAKQRIFFELTIIQTIKNKPIMAYKK